MNRNRALFWLLRFGTWLLRFASLKLSYRLAAAVGTGAYYVCAGPREAIRSNLCLALGFDVEDRTLRATARGAFRHDAWNWVDTLRIGRLTRDDLERTIEVEGWENLDRALQGGRGAILLSLHLGNSDLVGQIIAARGYRMTVPVERIEPPELFAYLVEQRKVHGISIVPVDQAPRRMLQALRSGEVVGMTADRAVAGKQIDTQMFGLPIQLPAGPVSLARHTGAPAMLAIGLRVREDRFKGYISPPLPFTYSQEGEQFDAINEAILVSHLETWIRRYPDQWLAFSPIVSTNTVAKEAATMMELQRTSLRNAVQRVRMRVRKAAGGRWEKGHEPHVTVQDQGYTSGSGDGS
jgi:KDO2-lipid IV(A) lauroyltransferase